MLYENAFRNPLILSMKYTNQHEKQVIPFNFEILLHTRKYFMYVDDKIYVHDIFFKNTTLIVEMVQDYM